MGSSPQHNRGPFFNADLKKTFQILGEYELQMVLWANDYFSYTNLQIASKCYWAGSSLGGW